MADYSKQISMFILFYGSNVALSARCYRKISSIDSLCDIYCLPHMILKITWNICTFKKSFDRLENYLNEHYNI